MKKFKKVKKKSIIVYITFSTEVLSLKNFFVKDNSFHAK